MANNTFEVGNHYIGNSLNNGTIRFEVLSRDEHYVTMKERWISTIDDSDPYEIAKYEISVENGIERICIWEYKGYEAYIYANEETH